MSGMMATVPQEHLEPTEMKQPPPQESLPAKQERQVGPSRPAPPLVPAIEDRPTQGREPTEELPHPVIPGKEEGVLQPHLVILGNGGDDSLHLHLVSILEKKESDLHLVRKGRLRRIHLR